MDEATEGVIDTLYMFGKPYYVLGGSELVDEATERVIDTVYLEGKLYYVVVGHLIWGDEWSLPDTILVRKEGGKVYFRMYDKDYIWYDWSPWPWPEDDPDWSQMTQEEILLYPMVAFFPLFFHVHSQWIEKAGFVRKMNRGLSIDFGGPSEVPIGSFTWPEYGEFYFEEFGEGSFFSDYLVPGIGRIYFVGSTGGLLAPPPWPPNPVWKLKHAWVNGVEYKETTPVETLSWGKVKRMYR